MGMDAYLVRLDCTPSGQDSGTCPYPLSPEQVPYFQQKYPDLIIEAENVDVWALLRKYAPEAELTLDSWDFSGENPWVVSDGVTYTFTHAQIEEFVQRYMCIDLSSPNITYSELAYMRKPFRTSHKEGVCSVQDGSVVLQSDSFAGADMPTIQSILGETALEHCMLFWGQESLDKIKALKPHTGDPKFWQSRIIDPIEEDANMYLLINW